MIKRLMSLRTMSMFLEDNKSPVLEENIVVATFDTATYHCKGEKVMCQTTPCLTTNVLTRPIRLLDRIVMVWFKPQPATREETMIREEAVSSEIFLVPMTSNKILNFSIDRQSMPRRSLWGSVQATLPTSSVQVSCCGIDVVIL